jgi:hypothetical protein
MAECMAGCSSRRGVGEMIGTLAGRQALARDAQRWAEREGRDGRKAYQSAMRRYQRYAAAPGRQRRRPNTQTIAEMRRVHRRDILLPAARLANERGTDIRIIRPFLIVSPGARRGDRRPRCVPGMLNSSEVKVLYPT